MRISWRYGLPRGAFDSRGNYNIGINEITIFPEIDPDKIETNHGLDINIVTNAGDDKKGYALLSIFGMPFAN